MKIHTKQPSNSQVIIYKSSDGELGVEVKFEGETAWLTQAQLADLFQSSKANVSDHIKNIYEEGELSKTSTVRKFRTVQIEGSREVTRDVEHYNLDLTISLGFIESNHMLPRILEFGLPKSSKNSCSKVLPWMMND